MSWPDSFMRASRSPVSNDNLEKIVVSTNNTRKSGKFIIARRLLTGDALEVFENTTNGKDETNVLFANAFDAVTRHVPKRAAQLQKRYIRGIVRKPETMTTEQFAARISELNNYLSQFRPTEVGGEAVTGMDNKELVSLLEFAITNSQERKMF